MGKCFKDETMDKWEKEKSYGKNQKRSWNWVCEKEGRRKKEIGWRKVEIRRGKEEIRRGKGKSNCWRIKEST